LRGEETVRVMTFDKTQSVSSVLWVVVGFLLLSQVQTAEAQTAEVQTTVGGHVGFVLPLVTHAGGETTNIVDNFSIGFPLGVTFRRAGRMAYDLELVPAVQGTPRLTTLTVHPGLVWAVGHNFGVGIRAAFDVNSTQWGFTPLVNHSWPIKNSLFKAYFVEAVLPVRFNRPTNAPSTTPVTFGLHFGAGF
jgi:hypothetical protein